MSGFALLWSKILDSSLWIKESKETRLVWIALLAMKNSEGIIEASIVGLADRAKVTVVEAKEALDVLLSPDPDDTSSVEEGRRIRVVQGGWQIVNHDLYRFSTEAKRAFWRAAKADQRLRKSDRKISNSDTNRVPEWDDVVVPKEKETGPEVEGESARMAALENESDELAGAPPYSREQMDEEQKRIAEKCKLNGGE